MGLFRLLDLTNFPGFGVLQAIQQLVAPKSAEFPHFDVRNVFIQLFCSLEVKTDVFTSTYYKFVSRIT